MKTILVVDDECTNSEVLALILADEGYSVRCAANGAEGLEKIGEARPDLVVLDVMMPVMDGPAMAGRMRASPDLGDIKIILHSSLSEQAVRERCPSFDAFLRKPYRLEHALAMIRTLLQGP